MKKVEVLFLSFLALSVIAVVFVSVYFFYNKKNFIFIVEASCDSTTEKCFHRDCLEDDSCPIDGLEDYKKFEINAKDFGICTNNSCDNLCIGGAEKCIEIKCGDDPNDQCTSN